MQCFKDRHLREAEVRLAVEIGKVTFACHALEGTSRVPRGLPGSLLLALKQLHGGGQGALAPEHGSGPPTGAQS